MPCTEWTRLARRYRDSTRAYADAVEEYHRNLHGRFRRTWEHAETARIQADRSRSELLHHEHEHECLKHPYAEHILDDAVEELVLGDQGQSGG